jgi:pimeloyl-ACP methyl ester carboxylesterase
MRAMAERWAPGMLHPRCIGGPLHQAVLSMVQRQPLAAYAGQQQALLERPDAEALLPRIACPTLVLCGRDDAWSPPPQHEAMARRIDGARLVLVDDCGHMSPMEQPLAVADALRAWLLQPPPAPPAPPTGPR